MVGFDGIGEILMAGDFLSLWHLDCYDTAILFPWYWQRHSLAGYEGGRKERANSCTFMGEWERDKDRERERERERERKLNHQSLSSR